MKNLPMKEVGWALAFVGLLLMVYVGAYLMAVKRDVMVIKAGQVTQEVYLVSYRIGDGHAAALFDFAHQLDQQVRRGHWTPPPPTFMRGP